MGFPLKSSHYIIISGYNGGLFVVTLENVPTACGAWPAFWMFGDDAQHAWPRWGEYDILDTWSTPAGAFQIVSVCFSELRYELSNQLTRYATFFFFGETSKSYDSHILPLCSTCCDPSKAPRFLCFVQYHDAVPKSHNISNNDSVFPTFHLISVKHASDAHGS